MKKGKKILSSVLAAAMILNCGITAGAENNIQSAYVSEYEAYAKKGLKKPSESFLDKIYEKTSDSNYVVICMDKSGKYSMGDYNEFDTQSDLAYYAELVSKMLSEDYYKEYYVDYYESYSEYKEYVFEMLEYAGLRKYFDNNGKLYKQTEKSCLYICVEKVRDTENSEYTSREMFSVTVNGIIDHINENTSIYNAVAAALKSGKSYYAAASSSYSGEGMLDVSYYFGDDFSGNPEFSYDSILPMSGEKGFVLGRTFVPYDTKAIFISSRDESVAEMLAGDYIPEDCVKICADSDSYYSEELTFDIKEIYKNLPELKELHMYQAVCTNTKYISKFKKLEALSYYSGYYGEAAADTPFIKLPKLKSLRLYGKYNSYSFLNKMDSLKNVHVEVITDDKKVLKTLYKSKKITSAVIDTDIGDLTGISAMTGLKKLEIARTSKMDMKEIGKLKNLTELDITVSHVDNISSLGNLKKLKVLSISNYSGAEWDFLQKMTSLRSLTLSGVNIFNYNIEPLKKLTDLSLYDVPVTYSVLNKLPKLKNVFINNIVGSIDSFKGSESLESYGELFGNSGDYSVLAKCPNLKYIALMGCNDSIDASKFTKHKLIEFSCNGTDVKNAASLAKIKTLEFISLDTTRVDKKSVEKIKKALPECQIVYDSTAFHNNV